MAQKYSHTPKKGFSTFPLPVGLVGCCYLAAIGPSLLSHSHFLSHRPWLCEFLLAHSPRPRLSQRRFSLPLPASRTSQGCQRHSLVSLCYFGFVRSDCLHGLASCLTLFVLSRLWKPKKWSSKLRGRLQRCTEMHSEHSFSSSRIPQAQANVTIQKVPALSIDRHFQSEKGESFWDLQEQSFLREQNKASWLVFESNLRRSHDF